MRLLLVALAIISLGLMTSSRSVTSSRAPFQTCSCSADDGSCSVNGICPHGCLAYCPSGNCRFTCTGGGYEDILDLSAPITLKLKGADSRKVAAELSRVTGAPVMFNPRQPEESYNLDVKDKPIWDVLDELSSGGKIQIAKEDFAHLRGVRQSFLGGERISVCFQNVSAKRLANDLSFLSGRDVYVAAGDPKAVIDYTAKGVTFEEIVTQVSQNAGVVIAIR